MSPPGTSARYLPPSRPLLTTAAELSSGSWTSSRSVKRTSARKVAGSSVWSSTVPTLMPLMRTSAPGSSPSTRSKLATQLVTVRCRSPGCCGRRTAESRWRRSARRRRAGSRAHCGSCRVQVGSTTTARLTSVLHHRGASSRPAKFHGGFDAQQRLGEGARLERPQILDALADAERAHRQAELPRPAPPPRRRARCRRAWSPRAR